MAAIATIDVTRFQVSDGVLTFFRQMRVAYARRNQRNAIAALLEMDASRLDDLGLSVADVRAALAAPATAGSSLHDSRARRALGWSLERRVH